MARKAQIKIVSSSSALPAKFVSILAILALLLGACQAVPGSAALPDTTHDWKLADLRWLNPTPQTAGPNTPVALYFRQAGPDFEFRLDLLDLQDPLAFDLTLALDTQPGGSQSLPSGDPAGMAWDLLLAFPAGGSPSAILPGGGGARPGLVPRILRDPFLDCIILQVNQSLLPGDPNRIQARAFLSTPGGGLPLQQTPLVRYDSPAPAPARLLLAFWNVLPSQTPAQALRQWDGAHTGPSGQRHGLAVLLRAAERWQAPLFLLDLKTPAALSALELLGGAAWLRRLENRGLVSLAQTAAGDAGSAGPALQSSRQAAAAFDLLSSPLAFGPFPEPLCPVSQNLPGPVWGWLSAASAGRCPNTYFAALAEPTRLLDWQGARLVPLPGPVFPAQGQPAPAQQVSEDGLSLPVRLALLAAAAAAPADPARLLVLGGSLGQSAWGDFSAAGPAFEYLSAHPWIQLLDGPALAALPAQPVSAWPIPGCQDLLCSPPPAAAIPFTAGGQPSPSGLGPAQVLQSARAAIEALPPSPLTGLAWQAYFNLSRPPSDPARAALQANYAGQAGYLAAAVRWAAAPGPLRDCAVDLDWDGAAECRLASATLYAILKPERGCLALLATPQKALILPSSLFSIGLSDPSSWQLESGPWADPQVIPGAFCLEKPPGGPLQPHILPQGVALGDSIRYSLDGDVLTVEILHPAAALQIPLLNAVPGSGYLGLTGSLKLLNQAQWGLESASLSISASPAPAAVQAASAFDSVSYLSQPELPDRANPTGHFLPFPFTLLQATLDAPTLFTLRPSP